MSSVPRKVCYPLGHNGIYMDYCLVKAPDCLQVDLFIAYLLFALLYRVYLIIYPDSNLQNSW